MSDLSGRIALVTGAASGIGEATARALVEAGAVTYRSDLEQAKPGSPTSLRLDVREEADWEAAVGTILGQEGRLDVLVHSAGVSGASPLADTTLEEWRRVLRTNLDGTFLALKHGIRAMRPTGGAIVVIGSVSGIHPSAGAAAYSTSKAAVGMLVRTAAKEVRDAQPPIRINALSPGGVRTPLWRSMAFFEGLVAQLGSEEAAFEAMEEHGGDRFAHPADIANVVRFLVSDGARHITGVDLPVDAGYVLGK
jgi:NAD(P)-dependent dehydrogenase (short-subunit alcohol dehydrogenase family)